MIPRDNKVPYYELSKTKKERGQFFCSISNKYDFNKSEKRITYDDTTDTCCHIHVLPSSLLVSDLS